MDVDEFLQGHQKECTQNLTACFDWRRRYDMILEVQSIIYIHDKEHIFKV